MNKSICLTLAMLALCQSLPANAMERGIEFYPTPPEIYADCQAALRIAKTDPKAFTRSPCVSFLHGAITGLTGKFMGIVDVPLDGLSGEARCKMAGELELIRKIESQFCLPKEEELAEYRFPEEYFIHELLRVWKPTVERWSKAPHNESVDTPALFFMSGLSNIMSCKRATNQKPNK